MSLAVTEKKPYKEGCRPLKDVVEGNLSMDDFVEQLNNEELAHLLGGQPNTGVANTSAWVICRNTAFLIS